MDIVVMRKDGKFYLVRLAPAGSGKPNETIGGPFDTYVEAARHRYP